MGDDWKGWKNGKYDRRYRGVRRHSGQRRTGLIIAISVIVAGVAIGGYAIAQNSVNPQTVQKSANDILGSASNTFAKISSDVAEQTTNTPSKSNQLRATPNNILTEDNYYAQLVPTQISVTDKGRYNLIRLDIRIEMKDLPFDAKVSFDTIPTVLKDQTREYKPDRSECGSPQYIDINGKAVDTGNYSLCYSVDKSSNKFTITYTEPQFNYHATRIGYLVLDGAFFDYYDAHRTAQPHEIGVIDLTK